MYHKWESSSGGRVVWQLLAQKVLRQEILRLAHNMPTAGHFGVNKPLARVRQKFFWVRLRSDVAGAGDVMLVPPGRAHRGVPRPRCSNATWGIGKSWLPWITSPSGQRAMPSQTSKQPQWLKCWSMGSSQGLVCLTRSTVTRFVTSRVKSRCVASCT